MSRIKANISAALWVLWASDSRHPCRWVAATSSPTEAPLKGQADRDLQIAQHPGRD